MKLYRLINEKYEASINVGSFLVRTSDNSNQKLGKGMYFALSKDDAIVFSKLGKYNYSHLLECKINGVKMSELFDLQDNEKSREYTLWGSPGVQLTCHEKGEQFAKFKCVKGYIWAAINSGWKEIVILKDHIKADTVEIINSKKL